MENRAFRGVGNARPVWTAGSAPIYQSRVEPTGPDPSATAAVTAAVRIWDSVGNCKQRLQAPWALPWESSGHSTAAFSLHPAK